MLNIRHRVISRRTVTTVSNSSSSSSSCSSSQLRWLPTDMNTHFIVHFASAAVAVDSSHTTASSSASCSRFGPPSDFVSGQVLTMWFMVCRWSQSQEGDWARPSLCKFARHGLDLSGNGSTQTMYDEGERYLRHVKLVAATVSCLRLANSSQRSLV